MPNSYSYISSSPKFQTLVPFKTAYTLQDRQPNGKGFLMWEYMDNFSPSEQDAYFEGFNVAGYIVEDAIANNNQANYKFTYLPHNHPNLTHDEVDAYNSGMRDGREEMATELWGSAPISQVASNPKYQTKVPMKTEWTPDDFDMESLWDYTTNPTKEAYLEGFNVAGYIIGGDQPANAPVYTFDKLTYGTNGLSNEEVDAYNAGLQDATFEID